MRTSHLPVSRAASPFGRLFGLCGGHWVLEGGAVPPLGPISMVSRASSLTPLVDHEMSHDTSENEDESDELIDIDHIPGVMESDLGWNAKAAEEDFWNREDKGWGIRLTHPKWCHIEVRSNKEDIDTTFKGPLGTKPRILAYGPFDTFSEPYMSTPEEWNYRLFVHTTDKSDVLDHFVYNGNGLRDSKEVCVFR